jgi:outer membrane protein
MNRFLFVCTLAVAPLAAQFDTELQSTVNQSNLLEVPSLRNPKSWYNQHFKPQFPRVEMMGPARLNDFLVGGKLELSLKNYLELVLLNNTDIQIQKLGIEPQRNAITRALAPFDPTLTGSFRPTRNTQLPNQTFQGGLEIVTTNMPFALGYNQTLQSGTQVVANYNFGRNSQNANNNTFNPTITSTMQVNFTQPLLRNRGRANQLIPVLIAQTRLKGSAYGVEDQIQRAVQTAELAYWQVIQAREALRVQESSLATQEQFLKRSQRELELGAISPLDIYQPQQTYASQEVQVAQARYNLIQAEDSLRRQMGADLDPAFAGVPIVLTETVLPPSDETLFDREALVATAYSRRPDLKSTSNNLAVDELTIRQTRNSLLPDVSLTGNYQGNGRAGVRNATQFAPGATFPTINALVDMLGRSPSYGGGITMTFAVRDSRATADLADATVNRRLDTLRVRQLQQNIRLEVLNAITQVESSRASVKLAQVAMDFSQKRLEAEQKKYDLGVTTLFILLDAQAQLTNAQANVVTQSVQYRRNQLNLSRVTGQLLEERGIQIK